MSRLIISDQRGAKLAKLHLGRRHKKVPQQQKKIITDVTLYQGREVLWQQTMKQDDHLYNKNQFQLKMMELKDTLVFSV